jgi:outer membrane biosynthesis protein TonB
VPCIKTTSNTDSSQFLDQKQPLAGMNAARGATKTIAIASSLAAVALLFAGCASRPLPPQSPAPAPAPAPVVVAPAPPPVAAAPAAPRIPAVASWADYRRRAAQMIIAANPGASFTGPQPEQWQGIATVTVMLNADGSVRALDLMRSSKVAPQVNDMALIAARRAANYGPVSNLPQPWQFNETFLYNDDNKFQLVTIVEGR